MSHAFKPGDVAMVTCLSPSLRFAAAKDPKGWTSLDPAIGFASDHEVTDARPLVVIDPEDRAEVERLRNLLWEARTDGDPTLDAVQARIADGNALQAALRSFPDPLPPEPTGLGAVVEAINGNHFVRVAHGSDDHAPWQHDGGVARCAWSEIAVVRVHSEGWS